MKKIYEILLNIVNTIAIVSLVLMCLLVFTNVIARTYFSSIVWTEEVVRFLFIYVTFFGAIIALKDNKHFSVNLLTDILPGKIQKILGIVSKLLILWVLYLVLEGSWKVTILNNNNMTSVTSIPYSFLYGVGIITSIAMAAIIIINLVIDLKKEA